MKQWDFYHPPYEPPPGFLSPSNWMPTISFTPPPPSSDMFTPQHCNLHASLFDWFIHKGVAIKYWWGDGGGWVWKVLGGWIFWDQRGLGIFFSNPEGGGLHLAFGLTSFGKPECLWCLSHYWVELWLIMLMKFLSSVHVDLDLYVNYFNKSWVNVIVYNMT